MRMTLRKKQQQSFNYLTGRHSDHKVNTPVLRVSGLGFHYNGTYALENINFELSYGERMAVVGPNGAGKSTIFKIIAGVLRATEGEVQVFGNEPGGHICIAYIPQRSQIDWNFPVTVADVVMMGRVSKMGLFHWPSRRDWEIVHQALNTVGMAGISKRQIGELSGGQQQRVFIARALAQEAELMLMDEPLTGLDSPTQEEIFRVLDELRQRNVTLMVALHDLKIAAERFDRILLLNRRLIGLGTPDQVFEPSKLMVAYGGHLRIMQTDEGVLAVEDTCCEEGDHRHD
jgi:manganese/iron transport system ATP-binding protein